MQSTQHTKRAIFVEILFFPYCIAIRPKILYNLVVELDNQDKIESEVKLSQFEQKLREKKAVPSLNFWRALLMLWGFPWTWPGYWRTLPYKERQKLFIYYIIVVIVIIIIPLIILVLLLY